MQFSTLPVTAISDETRSLSQKIVTKPNPANKLHFSIILLNTDVLKGQVQSSDCQFFFLSLKHTLTLIILGLLHKWSITIQRTKIATGARDMAMTMVFLPRVFDFLEFRVFNG